MLLAWRLLLFNERLFKVILIIINIPNSPVIEIASALFHDKGGDFSTAIEGKAAAL